MFALPAPLKQGQRSLEECLANRRSVREFASDPLTLEQTSQLLWASQGITSDEGHRTSPSAGALYPLEIILAAGIVKNLDSGTYRYIPSAHGLELTLANDQRNELAAAALDQDCVRNGAMVIVITCIPERITGKYGQRGLRYMYMEAGHLAQNICLQATALGLGTVVVGAFHDSKVQAVLQLPDREQPLYILPVGFPL